MGVMCQIHLHKPPDGVYKSGSVIAGFLKYALDQDTVYKDIVLALKGKGRCEWTQQNHDENKVDWYTGTEKYVNIQTTILEKKANEPQAMTFGAYTAPFRFVLPSKIPSSYKDSTCEIVYYVSVKFIKPGLFNITKKFKTPIPVISVVENEMQQRDIVHGLQKQLLNIFGKVKGEVKLNATVSKSVVEPCGNVEIIYDIENNTKVNVTRITTNLVENRKYTANCGCVKTKTKKFTECKSTIEVIGPKSAERCANVVSTLPELNTVQYSNIMNRDYKIIVHVKLPMPHRNAMLEIPLVIGPVEAEQPVCDEVQLEVAPIEDAPPSYWEAMEEEKIGELFSTKKSL